MPAVFATDNDAMTVRVEGLKELLSNLKRTNREGERIVTRAIQESGTAVLSTARSKASAFSASGAFLSTLSIKRVSRGIKLSSNDQAAGVIEFARRGAKTISSKGTPLANSRLRMHSGVGVPRTAQPRSMVPAVKENSLKIQNKIAAAIERAICGNG